MKRLQLQPLGESLLQQTGATLLSTLLGRQLNIKMSCGGRGYCSTCRISVKQGMEHLSAPEARERKTLALVAGATKQCRLACQSRVYGDGVVLELPKGMYIEKAEDLLNLLGTRAPENILHPIDGRVLIAKDKIITRSLLEQSRTLEKEVERMRNKAQGAGDSDGSLHSSSLQTNRFVATGSGLAPTLSDTFTSTSMLGLSTRLFQSTSIRPPISSAPPTPYPAVSEPRRAVDMPTPPPIERPLHESRPFVLEPGTTIGKFLLLEEIGKGGAGLVYRALHTKLKATVAMKFLRPSAASGARAMLERFRNEAHLLAQLNHPNVVRVLDFEDNPTLPYVVMEFMDGLSASDLLKQHGRLPLPRVLGILSQVSRGLKSALQLGIIHRDVKPANILVTRDWTAKLVDLGLALKMREEDGPDTGRGMSSAEGTAGYMAPEQLTDGAVIDHRADIYSLGVTFYQMLMGKLPFTGSSRNEVFIKHLSARAVPPHELDADIPEAVSHCILRMMEKDPDDRMQTYDEVLEEFEALVPEACVPVLA